MATIRKRNNKWQVQIRRHGCHPVTKTFNKKSDADEWARQMEVLADRNDLPLPSKSQLKITLKALLEKYIHEIIPNKRSFKSEEYVLKKFITLNKFVLKHLDNITEIDFVQYRDKRLKEVKPATFNREIGIIQNAYHIAEKEWGIPLKRNPVQNLKKPKVKDGRQRRLSDEEYNRIAHAANKLKTTYLLSIVNLAIETGMRRSEILNIRKQHIDLEHSLLFIPITKTGYSRTIPLSRKALEILKIRLEEQNSSDRLFNISPNALRLTWERLIKRIGIKNLHFHDLRHEAITRLFERGLSVPEVALISGHRDYKMLMRYTHIKPENIVIKL